MSLKGVTPKERTWNFLAERISNQYAIAGIMGNLQAESGFIFNILETYAKKVLAEHGQNWTNETYTKAVDSGEITRSRFLNPLPGKQFGYGLAQWTFPTRKAGLYDLAKARGASIADEQVQLDFLWFELTNLYKGTLEKISKAKSIREATVTFLLEFEGPADKGEGIKKKRTANAEEIYKRFSKASTSTAGKEAVQVAQDFSKYINSTGTHYISNSGGDERGKISGGKAGDQTGREWQLRSWYNRPWNCVLRYEKDSRVGQKLAELGIKAALNDKIGYDQTQRMTYHTQLVNAGYDPSKITVACEADCSAGVIANTKAVGCILGISAIAGIQATYTGNMRSAYKAAGFTVLTASKYLTGPDYLLPGDILLNDTHHTCTNVTRGKKAGAGVTASASAAQPKPTTVSAPATQTAYVYSGKGAPSQNVRKNMVCTADGVNVRTSPKLANGNFSKYLRVLNKGDKVQMCDQITTDRAWLYVRIKCDKYSTGYIYDFVCADYFKEA